VVPVSAPDLPMIPRTSVVGAYTFALVLLLVIIRRRAQ
jgi:hypothetical protein